MFFLSLFRLIIFFTSQQAKFFLLFICYKMQKHFKSEPKLYRKLSDSFSDTEVEFRKSSREFLTDEFQYKCGVGDGKLHFLPSKSQSSKAFKHLKIKDEVKIDLKNVDSSSTSSARSPPKMYPIQEVSEGVSHASSKMIIEHNRRMLEVQKMMEANKNKPRPKSRSRNSPKVQSPLLVNSDVEILKPFCPSDESQSESEFAEEFEQSRLKNEASTYQDRLNQFNSSYGSLASFKRAQIHRLTSDVNEYHGRRQQSRSNDDSRHDLLSIRTYSTTNSGQQGSCFGCIFKPLAQICRRKSKKN